MVRLDATRFRYLSRDDFRVLTAIEMGMKNHEVVPTQLILRIAALKKSNGHIVISTLAKYGLIHHENGSYDGYKLTYQGYDFLAIKSLVQKGLVKGFGQRIGVGKESDVYEVLGQNDEVMVLKIHRLGRVCFRHIKQKRDYLGKRKNASFMYMSRLAAIREFAYLKALYDEGFPTPIPYEINRHCILMSKINGKTLSTLTRLKNPIKVYNTLMNLLVKFAQCGLIHGDLNEFNLLLSPKEEVTVIDFPQMVSINHPNAKELFDRDAQGLRRFFVRKLGYEFHDVPEFIVDTEKTKDLDVALKASGSSKMYIAAFGNDNREQERVERIMEDARQLLLESQAKSADDSDYDEDGEYDEDDGDIDQTPGLIDVTLDKKVKKSVQFQDDDEDDDESGEMVIYDDDDNAEDVDNDEDEDEEIDDRIYMRARHAKNANKYNLHSKFLASDNDDDDEDVEEDDDFAYGKLSKQFEGLDVEEDDDEDSGALYTGNYSFEDDDLDEDNEEDEDDDEEEGNTKKGFFVGKLCFSTRAEKKAYLQKQKDLQLRASVRAKREQQSPSSDQVRATVKRAADKGKGNTRNKFDKINKGKDKRSKNAMKQVKAALDACK